MSKQEQENKRTHSKEWEKKEEHLPLTKSLLYLGNVRIFKYIFLHLKTVMMMIQLFFLTLQM